MSILRSEIAPGVLQCIRVNGNLLAVETCNVGQVQEVTQKWLIAGGFFPSASDIKKKFIEGQIVCPVRVDENDSVEEATRLLLTNGGLPYASVLTIDTNYALSHLNITALDGGTDNNALISFDSCVVKKITIGAQNEGVVKITAEIVGMIDARDSADLTAIPSSGLLHRALTWVDCFAFRKQSSMRTIQSIEFTSECKAEPHRFLFPATTTAEQRTDQAQLITTTECKWSGKYTEVVRKDADVETFMHGGWMVGENLNLNFGPISALVSVPLFTPSQQSITKKLILRTVSFLSQMSPSFRTTGNPFSFA